MQGHASQCFFFPSPYNLEPHPIKLPGVFPYDVFAEDQGCLN